MITGVKDLNYIAVLNNINRSDAWKYFAQNTPGFMGGARQGANVGDKPHVQLWNPVASGKTLYVLGISSTGYTTPKGFNLAYHNVVLTTAGPTSSNKLIGGSAGVGLLKSQLPGSTIGTIFVSTYIGANGFNWVADRSPFRVPEGYGLIASLSDEEIDFGCMFDWLEL